jgi:hypothetical protein
VIFDPALYENFAIEKEWVRLRAENTLLWVNRGRTGLVSTILVAGSVGALVSLTPPAVATVAAATAVTAVTAFALRIYAASGVRIRQHSNPGAQVGDLLITQGQQARVELRLGQSSTCPWMS